MSQRQRKGWLISLITETQIKTTQRHHFLPIGLQKIQKLTDQALKKKEVLFISEGHTKWSNPCRGKSVTSAKLWKAVYTRQFIKTAPTAAEGRWQPTGSSGGTEWSVANPRWAIPQGTRDRAGAVLERSPGHWRMRNTGQGAGSVLLPTLGWRLHDQCAHDTHLDT